MNTEKPAWVPICVVVIPAYLFVGIPSVIELIRIVL
jgi:hypothetical protein